MPCQYCSAPQTKGEWWDGGFGFLQLRRTKWKQIIRKLWTSGNGPAGTCWGHHSEMCYSSYILWTYTWLTDSLTSLLCLHFDSMYQTQIRGFASRSDTLAHTVWTAVCLELSTPTTCFSLPTLGNIISNMACLRSGGEAFKTILNTFGNAFQTPSVYEDTCAISCGRRSCSFLSESSLNQGAAAGACVPPPGAMRLIKGQACVRNWGWELVDAHHMGSCGPPASVGGWAPVGTGLCCSRSDPWRPAAAAAEPAAWRSSSSPPSC